MPLPKTKGVGRAEVGSNGSHRLKEIKREKIFENVLRMGEETDLKEKGWAKLPKNQKREREMAKNWGQDGSFTPSLQ